MNMMAEIFERLISQSKALLSSVNVSQANLVSIFTQFAILSVLGLAAFSLLENVFDNLESRNIRTGFAFLSDPAGFAIGESSIPYEATNSYGRAIFVGILNTLKLGGIAIIFSSILGVFVGISRLSKNWLIAKIASVYVEVIRNTPLLLQLVFWYAILTRGLPQNTEAFAVGDAFFLSNRGVFFPIIDGLGPIIATIITGISAYFIAKSICRLEALKKLGADLQRGIIIIAPGIAGLLSILTADWSVAVSYPVLGRFDFAGAGSFSSELLALLLALSIYTSAYLGETVRAGILSVPRGQREAAASLGMGSASILWLIVLPQALRVVIPPATSWHLNTIKNSSLAIAIGYPDLVSVVDTSINQTGQAIEGIAIIMAVYMTISLSLSALLNWYNKHVSKRVILTSADGVLPNTGGKYSWSFIAIAGWLRENLFSGYVTSLTTLALVVFLGWAVPLVLDWAFVSSSIMGGATECRVASGACWSFVGEKYRLILFGIYPEEEIWRPIAAVSIFSVLAAVSFIKQFWGLGLIKVWIAGVVGMILLMIGGFMELLPFVPSAKWGGLPITLILATTAVILAFPLAIFLALGRRSNMPVLKAICVVYIEAIRAVPLISVLFMASILFPLFLPPFISIDNLLRVQVALTLFAAAYMAEVIRGGLQAIPKGQFDAAEALGLSYWSKMRSIILPQALRVSFPSMVNTFISEVKNTTLVAIVGIFDLMNAAKAALTDADWRPFFLEAYVFVAVVFFIVCFFITRLSNRIEQHTQYQSNARK